MIHQGERDAVVCWVVTCQGERGVTDMSGDDLSELVVCSNTSGDGLSG